MTKTILTDNEHRILALIPKDGTPVSSSDIAQARFSGEPWPDNAQPIVISYLKKIAIKLDRDQCATHRLAKGKRTGPIAQKFWLVRK